MKKIFLDITSKLTNKSSAKLKNYNKFINKSSISTNIWNLSGYKKFADEGYRKNVIANRAINMISQLAASVPWCLYSKKGDDWKAVRHHPLLDLLQKPNPTMAGSEFFETLYAYKMISGNGFALAVKPKNRKQPTELYLLRPDRVKIIAGESILPLGYSYGEGKDEKFYEVNQVSGKSDILHIKNFNPLDDLYGLSQVEAAAYSIEQHNQSSIWNQSLLKNSARPCGALQMSEKSRLNDQQFDRLKTEIDTYFSGSFNAGKPILLEGGLQWKELSFTPKDMDFMEAKHSAARDIALAFGVPPQLLGIPGDNTYSNMQEARLALWEETILPMMEHMCDALNQWLVPYFSNNLWLYYDKDQISALSSRREEVWNRISTANFLSINEKRQMVNLPPIANGDIVN